MRQKRRIFPLALAAAFICAGPAMAWEDFVIETSEETSRQSLTRIAGPDHRGFSSRSQSYDSENRSSAVPGGGISF